MSGTPGETQDGAPAQRPLSSHSRRAPLLLVLLLLGFAVVQVWRGTRPTHSGNFGLVFMGQNAARYALAGRNYLRDGFTAHGFAPSFAAGRAADEPTEHLYLHHPPLAPVLVGASFKALGETESMPGSGGAGPMHTAILPFLILGCAAPLAMFLVARRCLRGAGGAVAALLYAAAPLTALYGAHVDPQGPVLTVPLLAFTWLLLRYRERGGAANLVAMLACLGVALLADWPAVVAAALAPLCLARHLKLGERRGVLLVPATAVLFVLAYIGWIEWLGRSPTGAWLSSMGVRSWGALIASGRSADMLLEFGRTFVARASWALLLLAAAGCVPPVRRIAARPGGALGATLFLLSGTAAVHLLAFPAGAVVHDYWAYLLIPPLALLGGAAVEALRSQAAHRAGVGFGVLVAVVLCGGAWYAGERAARARFEELQAEADKRPYDVLGSILRELVRPHERVLTNLDCNPNGPTQLVYPSFTYFADRVVRGDVQSEADLRRAEDEEGPWDCYFYVPAKSTPPVVERLFAAGTPHVRKDRPLPTQEGGQVRLFLFRLRP